MVRKLLCLLFAVSPLANAETVPTEFVRDRIYVVVNAPDGTRLRFYADTGGGWNAISESVVDRLRLSRTGDVELEGAVRAVVDFPEFLRKASIPEPMSSESWLQGRLVVAPQPALMGADGFLGSRWFAGRVWDIDYGSQSMRVTPSPEASERLRPIALGFRADAKGGRIFNFPRVTIVVDHKAIEVLLDTGATAKLSHAAATALRSEPGTEIGTSYVIQSIFDAWRKAHPHWRVIENADTVTGRSFSMIEVPKVTIGDVVVGPVWFTQRRDADFLDFMSQMTDRQVQGAIGGSTLKYLRVVLDYPGSKAYVRKIANDADAFPADRRR